MTWEFLQVIGMALAGVLAWIGLCEFVSVEYRAWQLKRRDLSKIRPQGSDQPQ